MKVRGMLLIISALALCAQAQEVREIEASPAQAISLTIYDAGVGMVRERRMFAFGAGENVAVIAPVSPSMDVTTVHFTPPASVTGVDVVDVQMRDDLRQILRALRLSRGASLVVTAGGRDYAGILTHVMSSGEEPSGLSLELNDGSVQLFKWSDVQGVRLTDKSAPLYRTPTLVWRVRSKKDQPQGIRVNYMVSGIEWRAEYDLTLSENRQEASLSGRIGLKNRTGGAFENARVRLIATGQGVLKNVQSEVRSLVAEIQPLRYLYRSSLLSEFKSFDGLEPVFSHNIEQPVTLRDEDELFLQYVSSERVPIVRSYVYDGVVFDQFQRNRRSDWNYGTESRPDVEVYVTFNNDAASGLGIPLAPGRYRLLQQTGDGVADLLGATQMGVIEAGNAASIRLGPARGLSGRRERISFSEVTPLHEYEETFEIRLQNSQEQDVTIQVIEHLYRWSSFEIVKADTEYERISEDSIAFTPVVKAGGNRTITYTVRYRW